MGMTDEDRAGCAGGSYYQLPLEADPRDSVTLLRVDASADDRVLVHLHRGVNRAAFSMRFGDATAPRWEPVPEPRLTLVAPAADLEGLTEPESVLAEVAEVLRATNVGGDGIYAWGFEGLLPNDEWVLHLTQLARLHERVLPARRSDVADDPRIVARVRQLVESVQPHTSALGEWLARARQIADEVAVGMAAQHRERRVLAVLELLGGVPAEDSSAQPNPDLPRIPR